MELCMLSTWFSGSHPFYAMNYNVTRTVNVQVQGSVSFVLWARWVPFDSQACQYLYNSNLTNGCVFNGTALSWRLLYNNKLLVCRLHGSGSTRYPL